MEGVEDRAGGIGSNNGAERTYFQGCPGRFGCPPGRQYVLARISGDKRFDEQFTDEGHGAIVGGWAEAATGGSPTGVVTA